MTYNNFFNFILLIFIILWAATGVAQTGALRYFEVGFHDKPDSINVVIATADPAVLSAIDQELDRLEERRRLQVSGIVARGTRYNNPDYHWHFVPNTISLTARQTDRDHWDPRYVEAHLDEFLTYGGHYRPSDSYISREVTPDVTDELVNHQTIRIFPNPADEKVFVKLADFPHPVEHLVLYDNAGRARQIHSPAAQPGTVTLEVAHLAPGYYTLSVRSREGRWARKVLIR
jgi:hypothetical protein